MSIEIDSNGSRNGVAGKVVMSLEMKISINSDLQFNFADLLPK